MTITTAKQLARQAEEASPPARKQQTARSAPGRQEDCSPWPTFAPTTILGAAMRA